MVIAGANGLLVGSNFPDSEFNPFGVVTPYFRCPASSFCRMSFALLAIRLQKGASNR